VERLNELNTTEGTNEGKSDGIEEECWMVTLTPVEVEKSNVDDSILVNTYPHFSKALSSKIDYERLSPHFAFRPQGRIYFRLLASRVSTF
jgi:hypothetical protein